MEPSDLPVEVSECIFTLLPVGDLLSCCLVNSKWRDNINRNIIWKHHCCNKFDLENISNIVDPPFQQPWTGDSYLSPICKYRMKYMKETYMRNNFRNGKFAEYECSTIKFPRTECVGKYLFLDDSSKYLFHVYDINREIVHLQTVPYLLQSMYSETFETVGNKLLIVQCNLFQIYTCLDGFWSLKLCRLFDKEEEFSHDIPTNETITAWYTTNIGLYPCDFSSMNEVVGDYFIGVVQPLNLQESKFHIWDLESGTKLSEEFIPFVHEPIETICCGKNSECLYIALYLYASQGATDSPRCKIFCYSLKTLKYTQFFVECNHSIPFMLFADNTVMLPCNQWENSGSYIFLDATSGNQNVEQQFDPPINFKVLDFFGSLMVFGSENTVTLVDLESQEVVSKIPVDLNVKEVYLMEHNFLLVGGVNHHSNVVEVWDLKTKTCTFKLKDMSILLFERSIQRLCLSTIYSIHILHFW